MSEVRVAAEAAGKREEEPAFRRWSAKVQLTLGLVLLIALALRVVGLRSDFWFDEIWSVRYAIEALGPADVYAKALDNNHVLNSLVIHWIGPLGGFIPYRGLAFASGLVALLLAVLVVRPQTPSASIVRACLIGGSPLLILLSTEARGYAPALAACLAGQWALRSALENRDFRATLLFNALLPLGLLSHLVFLHFYVASFAHALYWLRTRDAALPVVGQRLIALFALPTGLALVHGVLFVARMETGGGPSYTPMEFAGRLLVFGFGLPDWWPALALFAIAGCCVFALHLVHLRSSGNADWVFLLTITLLSPAFFALVFPPGVIAVRYFTIQILFFLLVIAEPIAAALERGGTVRIAAACVLLTILSGNALHQADFIRDGRGHYLEAMRAMVASEPAGRTVTIGGDHDSRVRLVVEFYQRFIAHEIVYVRQEEARTSPPRWFIVHDTRALRGHANQQISIHGNLYQHVDRYSFAYLSGFTWDVYRLGDTATPGRP